MSAYKRYDRLRIGCVADDFTGAGDIASFMREAGLKTALYSGLPAPEDVLPSDIEALVIALKSRTQETAQAVADCLAGFRFLAACGAETLYFKYCSTFDCTPEGNIGPVIDAVMEEFDIPYTLICPSLPVNGRTVKDAILCVNGVPLSESHMRHHPLTPMWSSDLRELMAGQGKYPCFAMSCSVVEDPSLCGEEVRRIAGENKRFYLCPDYSGDEDGNKIAERFGELPFLTGGSGLGGALARRAASGRAVDTDAPTADGRRLMLAGSCSVATRGQVKKYLDARGAAVLLDPEKLADGSQAVEAVWNRVKEALPQEDILVYTTGSGGAEPGGVEDAARLEQALARIAALAVENGLRKLIVAGGETSGAVTKALDYRLFTIWESVAPGVPVMRPVENDALSLVLKSGNFGEEDFLLTVLN